MAKAGFEPKGCLTTMEVLSRIQGAEIDTTHPAVSRRIDAIKRTMMQNPPETLKAEGERNLASSQPLTYEGFSKDGSSLRVNSSKGGSSADDIERLFGD